MKLTVAVLSCLMVLSASAIQFDFDITNPRSWLCKGDKACMAGFDTMPMNEIGEFALRRIGDMAARFVNDHSAMPEDPFPQAAMTHPTKMEMMEFASQVRSTLNSNPALSHHEAVAQLFKERRVAKNKKQNLEASKYGYFGFIPKVMAMIKPGATETYESECFGKVEVKASVVNPDSTITLTFTTSGQKSFLCTDHMWFIAAAATTFEMMDADKTYTFTMDLKAAMSDPTKKWYVSSRGILIGRFRDSFLDTIGDVVDTVTMMIGFATDPVSAATREANIEFLNSYVLSDSARMGPAVQNRSAGPLVAQKLDPSLIKAGDAMLVLRPDGLDPMIGYGEGSTVGHSVIFNRKGNDLYVCESTSKDAYWPKNGIQCHLWDTWIQLAIKAEHNVVWVPLSPEYSAKFNSTAAWDFFESVSGVNYGYQTFLYGWLDTFNGNTPCLPPDFKTYCLNPQLAEIIFLFMDDLLGAQSINFLRQAMQHRLGTWSTTPNLGQTMWEILKYAQETKNITQVDQLYVIPEQDAWLYHTTRNNASTIAPSMVCCVFVCRTLKAGGIFGEINDQINCGEQTLWDVYSMKIFDSAKMNAGRPDICKTTDPNNQLCQMLGTMTLHLEPDVNTRKLYPWMGEKCNSKVPAYIRQPGC